jgi:hypothetical protein
VVGYVAAALILEILIDPVKRFPSLFAFSPLISVLWSFAIFLLLVGTTAKYFLRFITRLELEGPPGEGDAGRGNA